MFVKHMEELVKGEKAYQELLHYKEKGHRDVLGNVA